MWQEVHEPEDVQSHRGKFIVALILLGIGGVIAWIAFQSGGGEDNRLPTPTPILALLPLCDTGTPFVAPDAKPVVDDEGMEYRVIGARGGLQFETEFGLGELDDDRGWLIVTLYVVNRSSETINLNSDDFPVRAGSDKIGEDDIEDAAVNDALKLSSMGILSAPTSVQATTKHLLSCTKFR